MLPARGADNHFQASILTGGGDDPAACHVPMLGCLRSINACTPVLVGIAGRIWLSHRGRWSMKTTVRGVNSHGSC